MLLFASRANVGYCTFTYAKISQTHLLGFHKIRCHGAPLR